MKASSWDSEGVLEEGKDGKGGRLLLKFMGACFGVNKFKIGSDDRYIGLSRSRFLGLK